MVETLTARRRRAGLPCRIRRRDRAAWRQEPDRARQPRRQGAGHQAPGGVCHVYIDIAAGPVDKAIARRQRQDPPLRAVQHHGNPVVHAALPKRVLPPLAPFTATRRWSCVDASVPAPAGRGRDRGDRAGLVPEYTAPILSIRIVDDWTRPSNTSVNRLQAQRPLSRAFHDAGASQRSGFASVMVNASTRFADGFGMAWAGDRDFHRHLHAGPGGSGRPDE